MRAGLTLQKSASVANLPPSVEAGKTRPSLMARLRELWAICSRAQAAAEHYETHKHLSDQELAARGLTRAGLTRAAFRKLTRTP